MFTYFSVANKPSLENKNPQTEIFFDDNTKKRQNAIKLLISRKITILS